MSTMNTSPISPLSPSQLSLASEKANDKPLLNLDDYLRRIVSSKVYEVAKETALDLAPQLSRRLGNRIFLKREDQQPIFSFKLRGAYNKMAHLTQDELARGVVCASAGNHAQGVALAAQRLGSLAKIVMPITTPLLKVDAVQALGGQVLLWGESYQEAQTHALQLAHEQGLTFIHPFDDPDVIAGQGTVGMEILRQHTGPLDAIFVAVGGGGLLAGVAAFVKAIRPQVQVIGVQMKDSNAMQVSIQTGKRVTLSSVGLFSDGTAVKQVGEETWRLAQLYVDDFVTVDVDAVCAAIKDVFVETRSIVEPAGALALAGLKKYIHQKQINGNNMVAILCGANMNFDRLRFVAERAQVGEEKEALLAVSLPEERGSFKRFCALLDQLPSGPHAVTEFNYRLHDPHTAHVLVGLSIDGVGKSKEVMNILREAGFDALDLTHDELSKEHIRHMVGGKSTLAGDERLLSFVFPERPGALLQFLSCLHPNWNVSLFHYRNQGADYGRILVGLQVPEVEHEELRTFLDQLGYSYMDETNNKAYDLFLKKDPTQVFL